MKLRTASIALGSSVVAITLTACGGAEPSAPEEPAEAAASEYPGEFTVANGDSEFYVGNGPHRPDTVSAMCSEKDGVITATITESKTGNTFTTTQPEAGAGYAGGTLTLGDGSEFTWVPLDGVTDEEIRGDAQIFEDKMQDGFPVLWNPDGTFSFQSGLQQQTTKSEDGAVSVQTPGEVDCSNGAAIN